MVAVKGGVSQKPSGQERVFMAFAANDGFESKPTNSHPMFPLRFSLTACSENTNEKYDRKEHGSH